MKQLKGDTTVWAWLTIGLIGIGLTAYAEDISALIKAKHATFELHGTISN